MVHSEEHSDIGVWIYIILMSVVLAIAILSNLLIIYCVVRLRNLRTITNIFICNLSVSDILLAAYVMPLKLHDISHHEEDWYEGDIHCRVVNFCPILVISSSIYTLVYISFERRQAIINNFTRRKQSYKRLPVVIFLIWIFAAGIATPTLFEYSVYDKEIMLQNGSKTIKSCDSSISREFALLNTVFVAIVSYVVPVILLTTNYTKIAIYVWKKGKWIRENLQPNVVNSSSVRLFKQRTRIVKLLILLAAIFAITWLPFFGILFYAKATGHDASEDAAGFSNLLLLALASFSTAYNVFIYVIFNPSFKNAVLGVLRCTKTSEVNRIVMLDHSNSPESPPDAAGVDNKGVENVENANSYTVEVMTTVLEFNHI